MACDISSGFQLGCRDNSGGIKSIYILSGSVTAIAETAGEITTISGDGVFYQFDLTKNTGDFTETPNPSLENGTVFYTQTVNASFHKLQTSIRNQVKVLAQNPDLKIVVETNNGSEDNVGQFFYVVVSEELLLREAQELPEQHLGMLISMPLPLKDLNHNRLKKFKQQVN